MKFVVITGLSGAGKTQAMHTFEDMGYYCVDNIPPTMLPVFYDLCDKSAYEQVAVIVDIRGGSLFYRLLQILVQMREEKKEYKVLFLDANTQVLIQRFKQTRRRHPFADRCGGDLEMAVSLEQDALQPIRELADYRVDTSMTSVAELKTRLQDLFLKEHTDSLRIRIVSFGIMHGIPADSDMVFDVRFLPNPYYVPALKEKTGLDDDVYAYVMNSPITEAFLQKLTDMLFFLIPQYKAEGKSELTIAVGCTGGHHRSVSVVRYLQGWLQEKGIHASVRHRDLVRQEK